MLYNLGSGQVVSRFHLPGRIFKSLRFQTCGLFLLFNQRRLHITVFQSNASKSTPSTTLTALYRTIRVLPDVLPEESVTSWTRLLNKSGDMLSGIAAHKPRIAITGLDQLSRSQELIAALLEDPLSVDEKTLKVLRQRKVSEEIVIFRDNELTNECLCSFTLNSPWLKNLNAEIIEVPFNHPHALPSLHDADIQLLVASPVSLPLSLYHRSLLLNPQCFLVIQYPANDHRILTHTVARLTQLYPSLSDVVETKTFLTYTPRALASLDIFRQNPASVDHVQAFQKDFLASGIPQLSSHISAILLMDDVTLKKRFAEYSLKSVKETCQDVTKMSILSANNVKTHIKRIRSEAENIRRRTLDDVLGKGDNLRIPRAVEASKMEIDLFFRDLPWWKLPFKIDDLSFRMTYVVQSVWCRGLRQYVEFKTGQLAGTREQQLSSILSLIDSLPKPYKSSVLVNELQQLSSFPLDIGPSLFTHPISYRLNQLEQSIIKLHRYTQRWLLTLYSVVTISLGSAYLGWLFGHISSATAAGAGILGCLVGLRWFVARWERAKVRWWMDWDRVGEGLESDTKAMLNVILDEAILQAPLAAAEALEKMVISQEQSADKTSSELEQIFKSLNKKSTPDINRDSSK